jgi:hypothetical protein
MTPADLLQDSGCGCSYNIVARSVTFLADCAVSHSNSNEMYSLVVVSANLEFVSAHHRPARMRQ